MVHCGVHLLQQHVTPACQRFHPVLAGCINALVQHARQSGMRRSCLP